MASPANGFAQVEFARGVAINVNVNMGVPARDVEITVVDPVVFTVKSGLLRFRCTNVSDG